MTRFPTHYVSAHSRAPSGRQEISFTSAGDAARELGAIGPDTRRGKRFGKLGANSVICFPPNTLFNEQYIEIGSGTLFGPQVTLSAGMVPGQQMITDPVISVGDRCLIGKGSGIVGHLQIAIGDDVWTGHHVYITDQNHGYEDLDLPISKQVMPGTSGLDWRRGVARSWHRRAAGRHHWASRRRGGEQRRHRRAARQLRCCWCAREGDQTALVALGWQLDD